MLDTQRTIGIMNSETSPRNTWAKLNEVIALADRGDVHAARKTLHGVRYSPLLSNEILQVYSDYVTGRSNGTPPVPPINGAADMLGDGGGVLRPPLRRLPEGETVPKSYPPAMALPALIGAGNDTSFLHHAAAALAGAPPKRVSVVQVVYTFPEHSSFDVQNLARDLARQTFGGTIRLAILGRTAPEMSAPNRVSIVHNLTSSEGLRWLSDVYAEADLILFLSGDIRLDSTTIERAVQYEQVSDMVVQPLVQAASSNDLRSVFSLVESEKDRLQGRYPFRDVQGFNFAASPTLLRRAGLPDARFDDLEFCGKELAFRLFNVGGYFVSLPVPWLNRELKRGSKSYSAQLFKQLCPNNWDREVDGRYEVPKVSVYIPTYKASKFIEQAVESVLDQDVQDLEVCLADDGSPDDTLAVLQRLYGDNPRVRWVSGRNGGIGHASNRAIQMARGLYIGQLDSDDRLKPGAVRRLVECLDEHPDIACAYGSCERIDAEGNFLSHEYSWPVFSREKMMITSIAHHFRMFRRAAWERTGQFREDIVNAVDYDIFLKLSEVGRFRHIDEVLYQRRWHGENTSNVNEVFQTQNTYRVQREALQRLGLRRFWDVHVPNPDHPRKITYKRRTGVPMVVFWPDYTHHNPYQKLLYGPSMCEAEFLGGKVETALQHVERGAVDPHDLWFHLHWLNWIFRDAPDAAEAQRRADEFIVRVRVLRALGGRFVWTIHNIVSHDTPFREIEIATSRRLSKLADVLHVHSEASIPEIEEVFPLPREKVRIARHGNYVGHYPDFISGKTAREMLGLGAADEVVLFVGQVRPYKGIDELIAAMRKIMAERPNAVLLIAGKSESDLLTSIAPDLTEAEHARIRVAERYVDDREIQVLMRAADIAVFPYRSILTSGSLLLSLSFGVPTIIPRVGMTAELLEGCDAGVLYNACEGVDGIVAALRTILSRKDLGELSEMAKEARKVALLQSWEKFHELLDI